MANTYTEANIGTSSLDWVRWRLNDRGTTLVDGVPFWIRSNEEIEALLTMFTDKRAAAAELAESMAVELSSRIDRFTDEDGMSVAWSTRVSALQKTAAILRAQIAGDAEITSSNDFGSSRAIRIDQCDDAGEYTSRPLHGNWRY